jgi:hypothetical protein
MKRVILFSALAALPFVWSPAEAQQTVQVCVHSTTTSSCAPVNTSNGFPVNVVAGGAGGGNVNLTGINGVTPLAGAGATGPGSLRTTQAQDTTTIAGSAPGTAGTPSANVLSVQGTSGGTSLPMSAADGQIVNVGTSTDAASCASGTSLLACQRQLHTDVTGPIPAPTSTVAATAYGLQSAASTNSTNVKNAAGVVAGMNLLNTTTTVYYLRMYNLASAPTCSSATGFVRSWPIPPAAAAGGVGGIAASLPINGTAFSTGISFCLTGGGSSTDNTNAATGVFVNIDYY